MALSVFKDQPLREVESQAFELIQALYQEDSIPWVLGYSGGKDSTATLQIIWRAIADLPESKRTKPVHVITTDTLVENPIIALWVNKSLEEMNKAAKKQNLPIESHRLIPKLQDTFWVNLIGRGYPAPRRRFRWCTERLKINPSNQFIRDVVQESGEAIVILGTRKAESATRAKTMARLENKRLRDGLNPNPSLPNSLCYTPIEDWSNDDVWTYVTQIKNPWGYDNRDLLTMYQGATEDGECPVVVDTSTPSCGDSRFGCWVCTLVDKDKSMTAMIQNDQDKEWMQPLLALRNELDPNREQAESRDFRRMSGLVQLYYRRKEKGSDEMEDAVVRGPYVQKYRERWLRKVLEAQVTVRTLGPKSVRDLELISSDELEEIRRIWLLEKHEFEDHLPQIYEEVLGESYPNTRFDDQKVFGIEEVKMLEEVCEGDPIKFQLLRELIDTEHQYRMQITRRGLFGALEKAIQKHFFEDEADGLQYALMVRDAKQSTLKNLEEIKLDSSDTV